uniref:Uncharacterized protein n=1 Tax=Arundo donax TaxID=35708 RepID=A0A0A9CGV9_ARUDO
MRFWRREIFTLCRSPTEILCRKNPRRCQIRELLLRRRRHHPSLALIWKCCEFLRGWRHCNTN